MKVYLIIYGDVVDGEVLGVFYTVEHHPDAQSAIKDFNERNNTYKQHVMAVRELKDANDSVVIKWVGCFITHTLRVS